MTVDCEEAANLISARIDGELTAADEAVLDAHLAECAACRAALEAAELQDAALVRAFAGGRDAAAGLADRVAAKLSPSPGASANRPWRRVLIQCTGWATAAAAGFIGAMIVMRPAPPATSSHVAVQPSVQPATTSEAKPAELIAQLALVSGEVFMCPSGGSAWEAMAPGAGVEPGAKVRTADAAKCELSLPGGSRLRLNSGTELLFAAAGDVRLQGGQIFSAVAPDADPLRIAAADGQVTTAAPAAQLDVARVANAATVTVVAGAARVSDQGQATIVRGGELLRVGVEKPFMGCEPVTDPVKATRWLDDLLLLLPPDDPELLTRVDALLARIVAERSSPTDAAAGPGPVEREVRARGHAWAAPLARYALNNLSASGDDARDKRRAAARLLTDVAPASCVADLIPLLADEDGQVRFHAAAALNRLTGQTLGFSPDQCGATPRNPAPAAAWQEWWTRNQSRYSTGS